MKSKDYICKLVNKLRNGRNHFYMIVGTIFIRLYLKIVGIKLGNRNSFYGWPTFIRTPNSKIILGNDCRFRSKSTSNLIGINHKCIIATHSPNAIVRISDGCGFSGTVIGAFDEVHLGNNVRCGANTLITDSDWHLNDPRVGEAKPVFIDDNVWLGYGVIIMKGVTIGKNSIIGAGSVVTKDIPSNVIAGGNPCSVIKNIF